MDYYVFNTLQNATDAVADINISLGLPRKGYNARTGRVELSKQETVTYAIPQQRLDGKYIVPRLISTETPQFISDNPHDIETYSSTWFSDIV